MNKLQQAAKEYALSDREGIMDMKYKAFLAGYEAAEGAFAEWASEKGWVKKQSADIWTQCCDIMCENVKTTAELFKLWQEQSL